MATNGVHFMKFYLEDDLRMEELSEIILKSENMDDDKFILNDCSENILDAYYVSYYNSKEFTYNEESENFEEVIVKKNIVIPFSIDLKDSILDVWSNNSNVNKLILKLGIILKQKVVIEPIEINIERIIKKIDQDANIKVGNVKIENYIIEKYIVANCIFDLKNYSNPINILKKYSKNLIKLTLIIANGEESITMIIYKNGSLVIYKSRDEISVETLDGLMSISWTQKVKLFYAVLLANNSHCSGVM